MNELSLNCVVCCISRTIELWNNCCYRVQYFHSYIHWRRSLKSIQRRQLCYRRNRAILSKKYNTDVSTVVFLTAFWTVCSTSVQKMMKSQVVYKKFNLSLLLVKKYYKHLYSGVREGEIANLAK
jgi:hypothetical protein